MCVGGMKRLALKDLRNRLSGRRPSSRCRIGRSVGILAWRSPWPAFPCCTHPNQALMAGFQRPLIFSASLVTLARPLTDAQFVDSGP